MFTVAVHAAPPRTDGMNILLGRATPSQTLPGGGAWVRGPPARIRKGITGFSWEGKALPDPPAGGGAGKPGFPTPLFESLCSR